MKKLTLEEIKARASEHNIPFVQAHQDLVAERQELPDPLSTLQQQLDDALALIKSQEHVIDTYVDIVKHYKEEINKLENK